MAESPGAMLKAAREARELSARETADRLCWRPDYVAVIERDAYEDLRNPAFAKGYVKSYGELLGLDSQRLMQAFEALQHQRGANAGPPREIRRRNLQLQRGGRAAAVGLVILVLLLVILWWQHGRGGAGRPAADDAAVVRVIEPMEDYAAGVL